MDDEPLLAALDQHCRADTGRAAGHNQTGRAAARFEHVEQRRKQDSAARTHRVTFGEMTARDVHTLGIDVNKVTVQDLSGRPQFLVDAGIQPMRELI